MDQAKLERIIPNIHVNDRTDIGKLLIEAQGCKIKLPANLVNRGVIAPPATDALCERAQEEFDASCEILIVPTGNSRAARSVLRLIVSILGISPTSNTCLKMKVSHRTSRLGLFLALLSSARPIHVLLDRSMLDQKSVFENHFEGMTLEEFAYDEFEETRENLVKTIHANLTGEDREFIL